MITIDLPMPPSVNGLWRAGKRGVYISKQYKAWKANADNLALLRKALAGHQKISTAFEINMALDRDAARAGCDLDNRLKAVIDWLQSRDVISNDNLCTKLTVEWVSRKHAPDGCRVTITRGTE